MKIHNTEKQEIIRLTIKGKETEYLNIVEADHFEVVKYLEQLFKENTIKKGDKVAIDARHCIGGVNGKSVRTSLFGISAEEVKEKITTDLGHKNLT